MSIIIPANTLASGGYEVANSVRLFSNTYMHKTSGTGNRRTFTISTWLKRSGITVGNEQHFFNAWIDSDYRFMFYFDTSDRLVCRNMDNGSANLYFVSNRVFRDISAWYNFIVAIDTTQGTEANRVKIYVNGVQETSFSTDTYPDQNTDLSLGTDSYSYQIGRYGGDSNYLDGYLSEYCMIDASALAPTSFGEFDEDSGIWKPIKVSGLTFGTNGFYLDFEASGNLGNDANGGTDLTEVNLAAVDQSTDTCTNNFATLNRLITGANFVFSEGNLVIAQSSTNWDSAYSTIGVSKGKWYMEFKGKVGGYFDIGVTDIIDAAGNVSQNSGCVAYKSNGEFARAGAVGDGLPSAITTPASSSYGVDDIMGIAIDIDNEAVYFAKNGTYEVNSDPTSGSSKTGAVTLPNSNSLYFFAVAAYKGGSANSGTAQVNFGGGSVDAISSGNQDADGFGNFEYAVPSGYFALCTKNLAEYG